MKDVDPAKMRYLEARAREIAKRLDAALNQQVTGAPKQYGFALLLFSFNGSELTWISNAEREDMIRLMEEMLERWKKGDMTDFPGGIDARN
ncbi:MAG TPA: hypothetical protein VJS44_08195 [Pyrinomonadaceae bacterium]|nr:hypothetical protein [Pyrinomonadaceae bacterium]